ncbi:transposase [Amycolatopsis sp. NPDC051716]|uniref:transposase n=1 Tax=Amycolatopsis sp. NPDC051716 TaxID=3155804 RepID=UPI00341CFDB9
MRPRRFRYPGRKRADDHAAPEAILCLIRTGTARIARPPLFGASGAACWRRLTEWHEAGVRQQLHERMLAEMGATGLPDLSAALVDSTHLSALKGGSTPGPARSTAASPAPRRRIRTERRAGIHGQRKGPGRGDKACCSSKAICGRTRAGSVSTGCRAR